MFNPFEKSRRKGRPVELILFVYGEAPGSYFAYTNAEQEITHASLTDPDTGDPIDVTYEPITVTRGAINASGNLDKSALQLRFRRDIGLVDLFRVYPPSQVVTVTIREGHVNDPDGEFLVVHAGKVLSVGREGNEAVIGCEPITSSMRRPMPMRNYQRGCNLALYIQGPGMCNADKALATTVTTVETIGATSIVLPVGWDGLIDPVKYRKGLVEWITPEGNTEKREILAVALDGVTLSVSGLIRGLEVAQEIKVSRGCTHLQDDCITHTEAVTGQPNIWNYGGCDDIPLKNPIGFVNQFY